MKKLLILLITLLPLAGYSQTVVKVSADSTELKESQNLSSKTILKVNKGDVLSFFSEASDSTAYVKSNGTFGFVHLSRISQPYDKQTGKIFKINYIPIASFADSSAINTGVTTSPRTNIGAIHTGPRGGKYYINKNGNKTYIKKN